MQITPATSAILLGAASLVWIVVLARIFFLPGDWNVQWWLNTGPFVVGGLGMVGVAVGWLEPLVDPLGGAGGAMASASVLVTAAGLVLAGCTLGTHRRRLALWHQTDDEPAHLVTEGPYARIRHPFYTSYLVCLVGCALAAPHPVTMGTLLLVAYRLNGTAAREEGRFLRSETFGARYAAYVRRTGRFVPRWTRRRASAVATLLVALAAAGCMTWTVPTVPPREAITRRQLGTVRLHLTFGNELVLRMPAIRNDSIVGRPEREPPEELAVSLTDVQWMEVREVNVDGVARVIGVIAGSVLLAVVLGEECAAQPAYCVP